MNEFALLSRRTGQLQKQLDRGKTQNPIIQDYDFMVTPTCPPTTSISIRSGKAWRNAAYWFVIGYNVEKPTVTIDLTTEKIVKFDFPAAGIPLDLSFVNPYYYKSMALMYNLDWIFYEQYGIDYVEDECKFHYLAADTEYATAGEAEAEIDLMLNGGLANDPYAEQGLYYTYSFPIWSIILRNTGITGADGQIQPIDQVNRGRSYLYRDLRPGKNWIVA